MRVCSMYTYIWSSLKSVWVERAVCWNEVIVAADLSDTHYYFYCCDLTSVWSDSMNNTCAHPKVTSPTFSCLSSAVLHFASSLLTGVTVVSPVYVYLENDLVLVWN